MINELKWDSLSYQFDGRQPIEFPNGSIRRGEITAVIGQSGSGKSTWIQLLSGILPIQSGNVFYDQTGILGCSERKRDKLRAKNLGLIFQKNHFLDDLNVLDNLLLPAFALRMKPDLMFIETLADSLNVSHLLHSKPKECSVGELQRLSIVRTLSTRPSFILSDEPTSALDDTNTAEILKIFDQISKTHHVGILIVTHDHRVKSHVQQLIQFG